MSPKYANPKNESSAKTISCANCLKQFIGYGYKRKFCSFKCKANGLFFNTEENRFMDKIHFIPESGCWLFDGVPVGDGYCSLRSRGKARRAYRWSYEHFIGKIPDGLVVCHKCDVPCCVNPKHLFTATQAVNISDKVFKNRQAKGSSQGSAKLTESEIPEIRATTGILTSIGLKYGIDRSMITRIKNRTAWRHVP